MAYHREERFPRGGKWYTQLYSQVILVESRRNYVVLQNENLNWEFYNSENRLLFFFFLFLLLSYFILFYFYSKKTDNFFFALKTNFITKYSLGRNDLLLREQGTLLVNE